MGKVAIFIITAILILFYWPVWLGGKVPLNSNFLVAFYPPWKFEEFPGYPTGIPFKQGGGYDTIRIGYPYIGMVHDAWKKGEIPLWNPYNFAGLPLAAESQSAAFYPLQFFSIFLSQIQLWTLFTLSGFFLCFLFSFYYFKFHTNHLLASIFGAFTFTFNTFFIAWSQEVVTAIHAVLWLPLILLCLDSLLKKITRRWWILLVFSYVLSILSGYTQMTIYVLLLSMGYSFWQVMTNNLRAKEKLCFVMANFLALTLSILLTLFQLLPLYEMYNLSSRPIVDMKAFLFGALMPVYAPIQLLIPEFFGSSGTWNFYGLTGGGTFYERTFAIATVSLIFALFALLAKMSDKRRWFFATVGVGSFLLTLDLPISRWIYDANIPVLSTSVASRLLFILPFSLAYLTAVGIAHWSRQPSKTIRRSVVVTIGIVLFFYGGLIYWVWQARMNHTLPGPAFPTNWTDIALRNSVIPLLIFALTVALVVLNSIQKRMQGLILVLLLFVSIGQMYYFFQKVVAFSPPSFVYPNHPLFDFLKTETGLYRFWGFGDAQIENNLATQMHLYSVEGYDSLANRRLAQLLKVGETKGIWTDQLSRSDVGIFRGIGKEFMDNTYRLRLLTLTSTKYFLSKDAKDTSYLGILPQPLFNKERDVNGTQIYSYSDVLPRATLIPKASIARDEQVIFDRLFDPTFNPKEVVIIEKDHQFTTTVDHNASTTILNYQPNRVVIQATTQTPQWLLLTDSYYPGWHATVDGKETEIYRANFAFRAVPIPAGNHSVIFNYWPHSFSLGLRLSAVTAVIMTGGLFFFLCKKRSF